MTKRRGKKHLEKAIKATLDVKSDKPVLSPALVGAYVDGAQTVKVSGRPDYIWVRIRGATSEVAVAFNDKVGEVWDLPILVYRDPDFQDRWRVYGRDIRAYEDWGGVSYVQPHGPSHSFSNSELSGADVAWIYKRQYNPLQPHPLATGTAGIYLEPDFYYAQGAYHWWPGSGTGDLIAGNLPTGASNARYVTVYLDSENKIPGFLLGPEFNIYYPPADPGEYIALPDPATGVPIGAVRLYTGTTSIGWNEIYDLRSPQQPLNPSGTTTDIYDENVLLGTARGFNFVGDGVQAVISGTVAHIMHTGSAGGGGHETGTMVLYDESDWIGVFDEMRFIGPGVSVFNSGSYAAIAITGTAGGGGHETGTMVTYDEDVFVGVFEEYRFIGDNIAVYNSGSYAAIVSTGTASAIQGTGTYLRSGEAYPLETITGGYWNVTEGEYMTGTLAVAVNGVWQTPVIDFTELYPPSGTFIFTNSIETGTVVSAVWGAPDSGGGGGGTTTIEVYDESALLGSADGLNFVGSGVEAVMSGTTAHIMHTGSGAGGHETGTMVLYDEGDWLGVFEEMRFIGPGVSAFNSGSYAAIAITGTAGGAGSPVSVTTGTFYLEELIYEMELASATGSFVFPDVPQDYDHLKLLIVGRSDTAAENIAVSLILNNDTTPTNYRRTQVVSGAGSSTDSAGIGAITAANAQALQYGKTQAWVWDYTVTGQYTYARSIGANRNNAGTFQVHDTAVAWEKLETVTRVDIKTTGDFVAGSHVQIWGLKEQVVVTSVEGGGYVGEPVAVTTGTFYLEEVLYDEVLAVTTGSVVIPGISQEYDHLKLRLRMRSDDAGVAPILLMYYNGDLTGTNYRYGMHWGGVAHGTQDGDGGWIGTLVGGGSANDDYSTLIVDMLDYTVTGSFQMAQAFGGERQNVDILIREDIHAWEKLEAVNRIDLVSADGNIEAGSHIQLIGVKEQVVVTAVDGGGPVVTGSFAIFDESVALGQVGALNFVGDGVEAVVSGTVAHIMHTGSAGAPETGTMVIYDEDDWLGVFDEMRFIGPGVSAFNSGSYAAIAITGTAGGGGDGDPLVITTGTFWVEEVLYDVILASNTGSVVVPVIPQDYDHLKVKVLSRSTIAAVAEFFNIYYNNDQTNGNYRYANHHAGTSHSTSVGDAPRAGISVGATGDAGMYGLSLTEIMDYTVTGTLQVARSIGGDRESSTTIYNRDQFFGWEKYEAINRLDIVLDTGDWVAGSHFQVIGVKETVLVTAVEGTVSQVGITTGSSVIAEWEHDGTATGAFSLVIPAWAYDLYDDMELIVVARTDRDATLEGLRMQWAEEGGSIDTGNNYWRRSEENYAGGATTESNLAADNIHLGRFAFGGATAEAGRFGHGQFKVMGALKPTDAPTIQGSAIIYEVNDAWRRDLVFGGWRTQARLGQIDIWTANASNYVSGSYARLIGLPAKDVSGGGGGYTEGARAYNSEAIVLTTATWTALTLDSERWDTDEIHDTGLNTDRLTCKTAGKYHISGSISFTSNVTGRRGLGIYLNGTTYIALQHINATNGGDTQMTISTIYDLSVNDYVTLHARQESGGDLNVKTASNYSPELSMHRIGP